MADTPHSSRTTSTKNHLGASSSQVLSETTATSSWNHTRVIHTRGGSSNHTPQPTINKSIGRTIQNSIVLLDREVVHLTTEREYTAAELLLKEGELGSKLKGKLIGHGNPAKGAPSTGCVYLYVWAQGSGFGRQCRILNVGEKGGMVPIRPEQVERLSEVRAMMVEGEVVPDKAACLRWRSR